VTRGIGPAVAGATFLAIFAGAMVAHHRASGRPLCVDGRPAPRPEFVTYGGLAKLSGMVRDHVVPLGLGGPDVRSNMQYQTYADADAKDRVEHTAIEGYCAGRLSLDEARAMVAAWRP
jgi:hypothetical protein